MRFPVSGRQVPHRWTYPATGIVLATVAPAGLLLVRNLIHHGALSWSHAHEDLAAQPETYAYLAIFTVCVLVVLGWVLGRKEDKLEATATTDELTGLANRRHFQERLSEEARKAARYGTTVSLLLIDLDRLKQINDEGGHDAGDRALRWVSEALRRSVRATDVAARQGGDEFAIIAPSTQAREALALATRICAMVQALSGEALSVSIGVADIDRFKNTRPGELAATLYAAADRALYRAKTAGRNRVEISDEEPGTPADVPLVSLDRRRPKPV